MFKTVLLPVNIEDLDVARPALEKASKLAEASGAALRLMNVEPIASADYMNIPELFSREREEQIEGKLQQIAAKFFVPRERVSWAARNGGVYHEILAEAEEWGADLIVLGSHRPSMATYLFGSNAKSVARHAKCSVLIVHEQ